MKTVGIALLGYGTVGKAFEKLLLTQKDSVKRKLNQFGKEDLDLELRWIYYRNQPPKIHSTAKLTSSFDEILSDENVEIIVELMGGREAASFMFRAMDKGLSVVTANKLALFTERGELEKRAKEKKVDFYYEASVAAAIPILKIMRESLIYDEILELQGIINGSTNFILTKISQGMDYEEALKLARDLGYLEADPDLDLEGYDALYKLGILCYTAFGEYPVDIQRQGIESLWKTKGKNKLKLIARGTRGSARLSLEEIDPSSPFYPVDDGENALLVKTKYGGNYFFRGAGAGGEPTATAVLSDAVALAQKRKSRNLTKV